MLESAISAVAPTCWVRVPARVTMDGKLIHIVTADDRSGKTDFEALLTSDACPARAYLAKYIIKGNR